MRYRAEGRRFMLQGACLYRTKGTQGPQGTERGTRFRACRWRGRRMGSRLAQAGRLRVLVGDGERRGGHPALPIPHAKGRRTSFLACGRHIQ
eukprot:scaffold171248_cov33-Tisochrysis_lutea.AAC.2